jgi:ubiquitin-protein ligase
MDEVKYEEFEYKFGKLKIIYPSENSDYYIVIGGDEKQYSWLDKVNKFCILKNPTMEKLKQLLKKYIDKSNKEQTVDLVKVDKEFEYYTVKANLQKLISSSISPLITEKKVGYLFDTETVANIIINEYVDCFTWLNNEKNTELKIHDNNIYIWRLHFCDFKNSELMEVFHKNSSITGVDVEIVFHGELYPNYPPMIKIINPYFKNSLNYRITNSKMVQLDYWNPTRSIKYIINRIINIIEKFGEVDVETSINKTSNKYIIELENYLMKLASFTDSINENDDIDKDEKFTKVYDNKHINININKQNNAQSKQYWKQGTGYGHNNSSHWNINEYEKSQKEKDNQLLNILNDILSCLSNINNKFNIDTIVSIVDKSLLIPYLIHQFKYMSQLDMEKKEDLFKLYVLLLKTLSTSNFIHLLNKQHDDETLYKLLKLKYQEFKQILVFDKTNKLAKIYISLFESIDTLFSDYKIILEENDTSNVLETNNESEKTIEEQYKEIMSELRFCTENILNTNYRKEYKIKFTDEKSTSWNKCLKKLAPELVTLSEMNQLPISYNSSILICVDKINPMIIRVFISGSDDTPYDSGCFIFDIYICSSYPNSSPEVWFMNHGGKRFNPNLYDSGKVCLSLLGTYIGPAASQSEKWNPSTSTLLQVLISIQAQILIDEPYFNEPTYELTLGTELGKKNSENYNANIRLYTMKHAVCDLLENPKQYQQFEEAIKKHFKLKKEYILELYKKWCDEAPNNLKKDYDNTYEKIVQLLDYY